MSVVIEAMRERVRAARASGAPIVIRGGGTKDFYGNSTEGEILDPRELTGIVAYEPTELVVTVRGGTSLSTLEAALAEHRQMLAFEPPHFGDAATVGGMIASGLAGPRRMAAGPVREFILGARLIDGSGNVLSFGGQVMKNVAGYDVARVLAGSLGTLGVIVEASIKVLPRPAAEHSLRFELGEAAAIRRVNEWAGRPLPISATSWQAGQLTIRLSGATAGVKAAAKELGGEAIDGGSMFWQGLREQSDSFFVTRQPASALWRLAVPSATPPLDLGPTLFEWNGGQRWIISSRSASDIRARVGAAGGHATRFRSDTIDGEAFHPLDTVVARLHERLKAEFDPARIFNRGRLFSGL